MQHDKLPTKNFQAKKISKGHFMMFLLLLGLLIPTYTYTQESTLAVKKSTIKDTWTLAVSAVGVISTVLSSYALDDAFKQYAPIHTEWINEGYKDQHSVERELKLLQHRWQCDVFKNIIIASGIITVTAVLYFIYKNCTTDQKESKIYELIPS